MVEKIRYPCPCGGKVKWKKERVVQEGVDCGILDVEVCDKCNTKYLPDESMLVVENKLKEVGLWGVERSRIRFWKSGNSVVFRLPTKMARAIRIKQKGQAMVYQEGKNKLVIDI